MHACEPGDGLGDVFHKQGTFVRAAVAAVIVSTDGLLLAGVRKGPAWHGGGRLAMPGGSIKPGESLARAAEREVEEETGLKVRCLPYSQVTPELFLVNHVPPPGEGDHFLVAFLECRIVGGTLGNPEADRCEGWHWHTFGQLAERAGPEAVSAWREGRPHETLQWIPLPQLAHFREHLGLIDSLPVRRNAT
jgi:8-oxo-dGTP diphosphatase